MTPRQIREQAEYEARKAEVVKEAVGGWHHISSSRTVMTATDRRNFYRKQAGWPQLRSKR